MEKIIKVFFDQSGLPFKERELVTHFPIYGKGGFLGASNTTKIRFYFENIGLLNDTYLAVSKLPNGKQGSQLLNIKSIDENGQYAELSLSEWYFQAKGDVFIGLKVYRGGVDVTVDEETGFSIVSGDPVIMVTGSIMLAVNYAPIGDVPDYEDEFTAYNDILALMREKPDIETVPLLVNFSDYATWGALYEYVGNRPFIAYVNGVLSVCAIESEDSAYKLLVNNSTGIFRTSTFALDSAISIALTEIELKTDNCVELAGTSGTVTDEQLALLSKDNSYVKVDTILYRKLYETVNGITLASIRVRESSGTINLYYYQVYVLKSNNSYSVTSNQHSFYSKTKADEIVSDLETKINASGHSLSATIDNQTYVMTIALKDKNNNIISTQQVDLPLESIVTSATYYDEYSYGGVDYEKVIVIVLATTSVPTIVPVGALVEGLITEETLDTTLKGYVKDVEITSIKTVAEVLEEIGGNNHIFSFDLMGIKYLGLFVEGQGTDTDLELWSPSGTSKVASIDITQLFRTEMSNAVVESSYFPIVVLSQPITTLSDDQMTILGQDNSVISYAGKLYYKSNDTSDRIEFVCPDIDDTYLNSYHTQSKYEILVNKSTNATNVITITNYYYDKTQTDILLGGKQNTLVSGQNIKTINGQSILGSGDLPISGGGSAEWGSIGGDITDQTDLQNELQDIREVAEGKCKTYVLSYQTSIASLKQAIEYGDVVYYGNVDISQDILNGDYDNEVLLNASFNSQSASFGLIAQDQYIVVFDGDTDGGKVRYKMFNIDTGDDLEADFKTGDIFLVIETDVPDRWYNPLDIVGLFQKLETAKVDLDNYATKTEVAQKSDLTNVAPTYDDTLTYTIGEVVSYNGKIYKCTTAITTPENWDSTHWTETSAASDFVNLTGMQVIDGIKVLANGFKLSSVGTTIVGDSTSIFVSWNDAVDIGKSNRRFKNVYISGAFNPNASGYGLSLPDTTSLTSNKEIATTDQIDYVVLKSHAQFGALTGDEVYKMRNGGFVPTFALFNGTQKQNIFMQLTNISGVSYKAVGWFLDSSRNMYLYEGQISNVGEGSTTNVSYSNFVEKKVIDLMTSKPTSVSLSDGGTITDNTLKTLIQNEQPIKLNGFTCYFSCDDGTNYQYVNTRYDSNANTNHINVITINKSTWVATFHTSDMALS